MRRVEQPRCVAANGQMLWRTHVQGAKSIGNHGVGCCRGFAQHNDCSKNILSSASTSMHMWLHFPGRTGAPRWYTTTRNGEPVFIQSGRPKRCTATCPIGEGCISGERRIKPPQFQTAAAQVPWRRPSAPLQLVGPSLPSAPAWSRARVEMT